MDITVQELKERLDAKQASDFIFLDVREPYEYEAANLGARLVPLGTIVEAATELLGEHKNDEIIIHCRSGARSGQAVMVLAQMGFTNVRNVTGGILAWQQAFG
jgi:sulfur-carrier protein adenylyltransferase/sulfurtransferase